MHRVAYINKDAYVLLFLLLFLFLFYLGKSR